MVKLRGKNQNTRKNTPQKVDKTKNKKLAFVKAFLIAIILIAAVIYFIWSSPLSAADFFNLPSAEEFGDVPDPTGKTGVDKAKSLVMEIFSIGRILLAATGVLLIVLSGFILVFQGANEEAVSKQKKGLLWSIIGLALVSVSFSFSEVFNFQFGSFLGGGETIVERAGIFNDRVTLIVTFMKYILGSIAVFAIVLSGFKMITAGDKEEVITNERKHMIGGVIGIIIILVAEFFVRKVLFKVSPDIDYDQAIVSIDTKAGVAEIIGVTNFLVTFLGPVMILGIVAGGIMYALSGVDEEKATKAKKILWNSLIGAVIVYGAFAIVSTMVTGVI